MRFTCPSLAAAAMRSASRPLKSDHPVSMSRLCPEGEISSVDCPPYHPVSMSLLIDTGWSDFSGRDADRIAAAAKLGHVKRIDYLLITHHHRDHEGGVPNLLERLPVGVFLDHGPSV